MSLSEMKPRDLRVDPVFCFDLIKIINKLNNRTIFVVQRH